MKKMNFFMMMTCLFLMASTLQAQLRLDVEGDGQITGKLNMGAALELKGGNPQIILNDNVGSLTDDLLIDNGGGAVRFRNHTTGLDVMLLQLNNGNVGIGTTSPDQKLTVRGRIRADFFQTSGSINKWIEIGHGGSHAFINAAGNSGSGNLDFRHADVTQMSITESGNVGIGTNIPQQKLHVDGKVRITDVPSGPFVAYVMINADGDLVRMTPPSPKIGNLNPTDPLVEEQLELLEEKTREIEALNNRISKLEQLVQQIAKASPKGNLLNSQTNTLTSATLQQNEPNPFTQNTRIQYNIPNEVNQAVLKITNLEGKIIKSIPINSRGQGETNLQTLALDAGQYFYSLILDGNVLQTKKMVLSK